MRLESINPEQYASHHVKLITGKHYLCGYHTGGDHPVSWVVLQWDGDFLRHENCTPLDDEECDGLLVGGLVFELPHDYFDVLALTGV